MIVGSIMRLVSIFRVIPLVTIVRITIEDATDVTSHKIRIQLKTYLSDAATIILNCRYSKCQTRKSLSKFAPIRIVPIPRTASKSKGVETLHPLKAGHSNKAFELHRPWTSNEWPRVAFCSREKKFSISGFRSKFIFRAVRWLSVWLILKLQRDSKVLANCRAKFNVYSTVL